MIKLQDISYVRLGTADLDRATKFATEYFGLEVAYRSRNAVYLKSDQREHTLCYFAGSPADQTAAFEVRVRADLDAAASELDRMGHRVRLGQPRKPNCATCAASSLSGTRPATTSNWYGGLPTAVGVIMASETPESSDSVTSDSAPLTPPAMKRSGPKYATRA